MNPFYKYDKDFLKDLDLVKNKEIFVKIYNLNFKEEAREEIQGKITGGSINIDGTSSVRRTCSLTLISDNVNINDYLWALNTKVKILIGVKNDINEKYDDIIWFNQGIFVLTGFNVSYGVNNYTINLSGQDKMCLLNGTVAGILPASIDFKKDIYEKVSYKKVEDFGPIFQKNTYYEVKSFKWKLDRRKYFDENTVYFSKTYRYYTPVEIADGKYRKNTYYILNPDLYAKCTKADWDEETNRPLVNIYEQKVDENGEVYYDFVIFSNQDNFKITDYYKNLQYVPAKEYDENTQYFYKNENNVFQVVTIDAEMYKENTNNGVVYYRDNSYIKDPYNRRIPNIQYYEAHEDPSELVQKMDLTKHTYEKDLYFIQDVDAKGFRLSTTDFDPNKYYYKKDPTTNTYVYIDFLKDSYNKYEANKYYVLSGNDSFILSTEAYNPSVDYYEKEYYRDSNDIPIKTIIKEAVHTYGQERYENIIINDLDDEGLLLKEYRGDKPAYLLIRNDECEQFITNGQQRCYVIDEKLDAEEINMYLSLFNESLQLLNKEQLKSNSLTNEDYKDKYNNLVKLFKETMGMKIATTLDDSDTIIYNTFLDEFNKNPSQVFIEQSYAEEFKLYSVLRLEYGDAAGYELKDLTYPEDLISSVGESLTSVLDKIISKFSDFEYFYDVDGRFIFQKKKTYLNTSWNNIVSDTEDYGFDENGEPINNTYVAPAVDTSAIQYTFENNDLIVSIQNAPKLTNLKNDYSIWGTRKTLSGTEVPIHARYAIDDEPLVYVSFPISKFNYKENQDELVLETQYKGLKFLTQNIYVNKNDYEFIIEVDYFGINSDEQEVTDENGTFKYFKDDLMKLRIEPTYYKGEMYAGICFKYVICDWREIIYQMAVDYYKHNQSNDFLALVSEYNTFNYDADDGDLENNKYLQILVKNAGKLYPSGITGYEQYYIDIYSFWRELYNPEPEVKFGYTGGYYKKKEWVPVLEDYSQFICDFYLPEDQYPFYSEKIEELIKEYEDKIGELKNQLKNIPNTDTYDELLRQLETEKQALEKAKNRKAALERQYFSNQSSVLNSDEYKEAREAYDIAVEDKKITIEELEETIASTLVDSFGLY